MLPLSCIKLRVRTVKIEFTHIMHLINALTSPAWFGFISFEHLNLIQKLLDKSYKWGLTNRMYNAILLFSTRDCQLFKLMGSSSHCLHHLLPPVHSVSYSLRQRGHPYKLLEHKYQKTKCSFIVRSIFDYL